MRFRPSGRVRLAALVAVVLGLAAGGIAYATIPDADGVIHGCYKTVGGGLRVIDTDAGRACKEGETSLKWNVAGQQGPPGPPGISGYEIVSAQTSNDTTDYKTLIASCPAGKKILGGGALIFWNGGSPRPKLISSGIFGGGWNAEADDGGAGVQWSLVAQAICANVS
jgi:hypothetical protein